jgi:AP-1 complex subunit gamma-1
MIEELVKCVPKTARVYRMTVHETNSDYEIGGVQDPFLQVAILRFLRYLRRQTNTFEKDFAEILVLSHDNVCARISGSLKNGANAVLF